MTESEPPAPSPSEPPVEPAPQPALSPEPRSPDAATPQLAAAGAQPSISAEPGTASAPVLRPYDLPGARGVVAYGLSLAYRSSAELRRASIYIGLLTLGLLGPPVVFLVGFLAHFQITDESSLIALFGSAAPNPGVVAALLSLYGIGLLALAGFYAVSIDASLIGIALLAARQGNTPFTLREAAIRARQVFWRMARGGFLVFLLGTLFNVILSAIASGLIAPGTGSSFVVSLIVIVLLAPFGYLATGLVLGDVGAVEALKRSLRLARARPRIALVVALFTLVTAAIQLFALFAGLDLFARIAGFVHLGFEGGLVPLLVVIGGVLALVIAFGSLSFTVAAIVAAPQVAAFLGLTFYTAGLDRARNLPATAPRFRWVTRPMIVLIVAVALLSSGGIIAVQSVPPVPPDPIVSFLSTAAPGHFAVVTLQKPVQDPTGDQVGPAEPAFDLGQAEFAYAPYAPSWLLDGPFKCGGEHVACDTDTSLPARFDQGAVLVTVGLGAPYPDLPANRVATWTVAFDLPDLERSSAADWDAPGNFVVVTEIRNGTLRIYKHQHVLSSHDQTTKTATRSAWSGSSIVFLIPFEEMADPIGWDVVASVGPATGPTTRDRLLPADTFDLLPIGLPPILQFPAEARPFPTP